MPNTTPRTLLDLAYAAIQLATAPDDGRHPAVPAPARPEPRVA